MAWPTIDPTTPLGTEKIKFGDDRIREAKQHLVDGLQAISNYSAGGSAPALKTAVWTTATRPSGANLVDRVTGYNSDLVYEEYYDLATTSWKPKYPLYSKMVEANKIVQRNSDAKILGDILGNAATATSAGNANTVGGYSASQIADLAVVASYLGSNGYTRFKNGLIIQWGNGPAGTVVFPIPFPNNVFSVSVTAAGYGNAFANVANVGTTAFSINSTNDCFWFAVGN